MDQNQKKNGRKRVVIAAGSLLAAGALITSAAFTDFANLNINGGANGTGIGPGADNAFSLLVAKPDAQGVPTVDGQGAVAEADWISANTAEGVDYLLSGIDELAPGSGTASVTIPMKNNSKGTMLTKLSVVQQGSGSDAALLDALRVTVTQGGSTLAADKKLSELGSVNLASLAGKADAKVTVQVAIADQGSQTANNALADKMAYITAHIDAASA